MRLRHLLFACMIFASSACHPGPVIGRNTQPSVGGTIAGVVTASDRSVAVSGRKVTAINVATGARFDATTSNTGGYTIKVPEGNYRIELELRTGETIVKQPAETHINNGDLDSARDFVISVRSSAPDRAVRRSDPRSSASPL
jgi:hypothetical protein